MTTINIYLTFNGNCREAFEYYRSVFGGEFSFLGTFGEMPPQEGYEMDDQDKDKIMHVSIPISKETTLMGSDTTENYPKVTMGNNFSISISTDSKEEADLFFRELSKGGSVTMPLAETFWSPYFGMVEDQFGINWMISLDENPQ